MGGTANIDGKRVAKNTLVLYVRMIIMLVISFFTARVTLNALGVTDYGINNVVGGLVSMFSLLSNSLSSSTSRFMTFGLGEGDMDKLKRIFSTSANIHVILAVVVVVAVETIGVWFLNHKMTIPPDRMEAANWVLQCSVVVFAAGLFSVPYNSAIIAHEKMSAFAYMTIFDAASRLLIIGGIYYYKGDKLILLALMTMAQSFIRQSIYWVYCKRKFEECVYRIGWDKELVRNMFGFAGWNFLGAGSQLLMTQGVNLLMNLFFGVVVNAARGVAVQVDSVVSQFVTSFTTAMNPQITKSYAMGEKQGMFQLVFCGARISYLLMLVLVIPIMVDADFILKLWLGTVPEKASLFLRWTLCISLLSVLSNTMITAMLATGNIKKYQLIVGGTGMLVFPMVYICYKLGSSVEIAYAIQFIIFVLQFVFRLFLLREMVGMSISEYMKKVFVKVLLVSVCSFVFPFSVSLLMPDATFLRFILIVIVSELSLFVSVYFWGIEISEREKIKQKLIKLRKICTK